MDRVPDRFGGKALHGKLPEPHDSFDTTGPTSKGIAARAAVKILELTRLPRWGKLDLFNQFDDLAIRGRVTGDRRDCGDDIRVAKVVITIEFQFG